MDSFSTTSSGTQPPRNTSAEDLAVHEDRFHIRFAKGVSRHDRRGDLYVAKVDSDGDICIKVGRTNDLDRRTGEHRRRCKLDENEFVVKFNAQVRWASFSESLLHHRLKAVGFIISDTACECGTHHIERYASSSESLRGDIDEIVGWIEKVRDL
ncbi:hypothetical protein V5O48_018546 [Marasmius crinis-equi]|uniref:Bacteriophage T5 Orf172 DNA-binding domain-containing protein n=1 Tax=Marasmius crinis-equi TaxID=585013 RepID=A0ABR3EKZ8_9AGAR